MANSPTVFAKYFIDDDGVLAFRMHGRFYVDSLMDSQWPPADVFDTVTEAIECFHRRADAMAMAGVLR